MSMARFRCCPVTITEPPLRNNSVIVAFQANEGTGHFMEENTAMQDGAPQENQAA